MFSFIKNSLKKIYNSVTSALGSLFAKPTIDESTLKELEIILLSADAGVPTTKKIMKELTEQHSSGKIVQGAELQSSLKNILLTILEQKKNNPSTSSGRTGKQNYDTPSGRIFLLVGINGSGKTTFAAKLAHHYVSAGKRVLMVAADTFRAAAPEQLAAWAAVTKADIVHGAAGQDPASVVFQGCEKFKKESYDILIIDTAGRLQTKVNLMHELAKIGRVITKQLPNEPINTLLTIDSMLGQNSFEQAKLFQSCTAINGIVLTKMDGTGKGGIIFAIVEELGIPIWYITYGEKSDQLKPFNAQEYIENLLQT